MSNKQGNRSRQNNKPIRLDAYGIKHQYNRSVDYLPKPTKPFDTKIFKKLGMIAVFLMVFATLSMSGYHAWSKFPYDSTVIKLVRTWIAVIFAPIYIFYIFIRTTVFKGV